jgi:hypothetical protein
MTDWIDPSIRAAEKQASRDQDSLDLAEGRKTSEQLREENRAIRLSGARIDFSASKSPLW